MRPARRHRPHVAVKRRYVLLPIPIAVFLVDHRRVGGTGFSLGDGRRAAVENRIEPAAQHLTQHGQPVVQCGRVSRGSMVRLSCVYISPVSNPSSIQMRVTPVAASPASRACWMGDAPASAAAMSVDVGAASGRQIKHVCKICPNGHNNQVRPPPAQRLSCPFPAQ